MEEKSKATLMRPIYVVSWGWRIENFWRLLAAGFVFWGISDSSKKGIVVILGLLFFYWFLIVYPLEKREDNVVRQEKSIKKKARPRESIYVIRAAGHDQNINGLHVRYPVMTIWNGLFWYAFQKPKLVIFIAFRAWKWLIWVFEEKKGDLWKMGTSASKRAKHF